MLTSYFRVLISNFFGVHVLFVYRLKTGWNDEQHVDHESWYFTREHKPTANVEHIFFLKNQKKKIQYTYTKNYENEKKRKKKKCINRIPSNTNIIPNGNRTAKRKPNEGYAEYGVICGSSDRCKMGIGLHQVSVLAISSQLVAFSSVKKVPASSHCGFFCFFFLVFHYSFLFYLIIRLQISTSADLLGNTESIQCFCDRCCFIIGRRSQPDESSSQDGGEWTSSTHKPVRQRNMFSPLLSKILANIRDYLNSYFGLRFQIAFSIVIFCSFNFSLLPFFFNG